MVTGQDRPDARAALFTSNDPNFLPYRHHPLPPFRQTFTLGVFCGSLRAITAGNRST